VVSFRCKGCRWWDDRHPAVAEIPLQLCKKEPGFCRKHKPGALRIGDYFYGVQPVMDAEECCGEFRPEEEA
jgi:hypothetical protein